MLIQIEIQSINLKQVLIKTFEFLTSELIIWCCALIYLAFINNPGTEHFTICPFKNLGIDFCPGCGLGNSISFMLHGDIKSSFAVHPFGIAALIILVLRIITLFKQEWRNYAKRTTVNA
jgi:Protein of unknown function (DUF2752)